MKRIESTPQFFETEKNQTNQYMKPYKFTAAKTLLPLFGLLTWVTFVEALPFTYQPGDLCLGFRKTNPLGTYELVADIGPITNYLNLAPGATITVNQYVAAQIVPDSFPNWTNLEWSVTGGANIASTVPGAPADTVWMTALRPNGASGKLPARTATSGQQAAVVNIANIFAGAASISGTLASNQVNTATFVQEPVATANSLNYSVYMADQTLASLGDLQSSAPQTAGGQQINLENTTGTPFNTASQADFWEVRPTGYVDPHSGMTNGNGYNLGYFQLSTSGTLTFTRLAAPVAGFVGSPTNGVASLQVTFTDTSLGSVTNWLWNFGDGHTLTNSANSSPKHTYTTAGNYTVTLTTTGPGGNNVATRTSYIVVTGGVPSVPKFNLASLSGGKFVISGTNGTASAQFRVLCSTNLAAAATNWIPVYTNTFLSNGSFAYTNSSPTNPGYFFRLVAP